MAMISPKGQQAIKEIRQLMKTDMTLERIAEAIDEKYGTIIKKTESDAIFTAKMTENYKQFVKDFPNFALVSVEKQMAMLDHAYQMGYGEGEFVEYWRNITKALNTTNPEHRQRIECLIEHHCLVFMLMQEHHSLKEKLNKYIRQ